MHEILRPLALAHLYHVGTYGILVSEDLPHVEEAT